MSDEVKAAAYRQGTIDYYDPEMLAHYRSATRDADLVTLASAYLAEHPADEGEPITVTWLLRCGFCSIHESSRFWMLNLDRKIGGEWKFLRVYRDEGIVTAELRTGVDYLKARPETRGQLRRLCEVMRIELKEQA